MVEQDEFEKRVGRAAARGIAEEKTRESLAVFKVIGAVIIGWIAGAAVGSVVVGVGLMLIMLFLILRTYMGRAAMPLRTILFGTWRRVLVSGFVGLIVLANIMLGLFTSSGTDHAEAERAAPAEILTPAQARERQIQAALNKAYYPVQAQIQSMMHDPDSFERAALFYDDKGEYIVMTVQFRGRNKLGAKVLGSVDARVGLDGSVWTVGKIE